MPFAARITDPTAHGGLVTVGFPTVLIGGMPASRIGDMHVCPMVTVLVPHVGGPFILGSFTVLVGSMPQSKVGDMLVCVGPPDSLIMGCPTVQVGMAGGGGGFGAIMAGIAMALGQMASGGYPRAQLQPDGTIQTEYNSQITIKGSPEYQATVVSDINAFLGTTTGQAWQKDYQATGKHITIIPIPANMDQGNGFAWSGGERADGNYTDGSKQDSDGFARADRSHGPGSDSVILYNPSYSKIYNAQGGGTAAEPLGGVIGHEMTHSLHNGQGNNLAGTAQPSPYDSEEESQTIGCNGYENQPVTESGFLRDNQLPGRADHGVSQTTYQDANGNWHQGANDAHGNWQDTTIPAPPGGSRPNH